MSRLWPWSDKYVTLWDAWAWGLYDCRLISRASYDKYQKLFWHPASVKWDFKDGPKFLKGWIE